MARLNTKVRIFERPATDSLIPWRWTFRAGLYIPAKQINTATQRVSAATALSGSDINPNTLYGLLTGQEHTTRLGSGFTFAPANEMNVTRNDNASRDGLLFFGEQSTPYTLVMKFLLTQVDYIEAKFNVTSYSPTTIAFRAGSTAAYNVKFTYINNSFVGHGSLVNNAQTTALSLFNNRTVELSQEASTTAELFEKTVFCEVMNAGSSYDVTIGEAGIGTTQSANVRIRYDPEIVAGYGAELDGVAYTITNVDLIERYKYQELTLNREL